MITLLDILKTNSKKIWFKYFNMCLIDTIVLLMKLTDESEKVCSEIYNILIQIPVFGLQGLPYFSYFGL